MLVIGISLANTSGEDGKTIVAATAILDGSRVASTVRVQVKKPLIAPRVLKEIIFSLLQHYKWSNKDRAIKRCLIYRDGGHDGLFDKIRDSEVQACQEIFELLGVAMPLLTFVVAQSNHQICLVPSGKEADVVNVPSGTVVDIKELRAHGIKNHSDARDFLLVAQGYVHVHVAVFPL
jgi:Piwi domain